MPAASAICCSEVRRPDVAMTEFAVWRISVRRVASADGWSVTAVSFDGALPRLARRPGTTGIPPHGVGIGHR